MGFLTDKFREPEIRMGTVVFADPKANSYVIQPFNDADDRDAQITATPIGSSTFPGVTTNSSVYEIGDYVIYICAEESLWGYSPLRIGIILCRFPHDSLGWLYENKDTPESEGARDYYDKVKALTEQQESDLACFAPYTHENDRISGDTILEGDNSFLRISDELIEEHAGNARVILNGVDSSITQVSATRKEASITQITEEQLVNDSTLKVSQEFLSTNRGFDKPENIRKPDKVTVKGDLTYGEVRATLNADRKPIAVTEERSDGGYHQAAVVGVLFEQTTDLGVRIPKYPYSVNYDDAVIPAPKDNREAFDRVLQSKNWEELKLDALNTDIRKPGDINASPKKIKDTEGSENVMGHQGRASFGFLPEGGFIIRDAWGSEIRMENGDIQISAARNLLYVVGKDEVHIGGGVLSATASDINFGSTKGNVDIQATKDININAKEDAVVQGNNGLILSGLKGVKLLAETDGVAIRADNLVLTGDKEITISATKLFMVGSSNAVLASHLAVVNCGDELTIGGGTVTVNGDLKIAKSAYSPGKLGDVQIQSPASQGSLDVEGAVYCKRDLYVDESVLANSLVSCLSVHVKEADPKIGVYQGSSRPKKLNKTFTNKSAASAVLNILSGKLLEAVKKLNIKDILTSMFKLSDTLVRIVKPIFSSKHDNVATISAPPKIDTQSQKRYIYPGESFWNTDGCEVLNVNNSAKNVREERAGGASQRGASTLKLHERKEQ